MNAVGRLTRVGLGPSIDSIVFILTCWHRKHLASIKHYCKNSCVSHQLQKQVILIKAPLHDHILLHINFSVHIDLGPPPSFTLSMLTSFLYCTICSQNNKIIASSIIGEELRLRLKRVTVCFYCSTVST